MRPLHNSQFAAPVQQLLYRHLLIGMAGCECREAGSQSSGMNSDGGNSGSQGDGQQRGPFRSSRSGSAGHQQLSMTSSMLQVRPSLLGCFASLYMPQLGFQALTCFSLCLADFDTSHFCTAQSICRDLPLQPES